MKLNKIVVYTAISGDYDDLKIPKFISQNCDYVCFTDNDKIDSDFWTILPFPDSSLDKVRKCRLVKILPHKFFSAYRISVWLDGNIEIMGDVNEIIKEYLIIQKNKIVSFKHPMRNCIYEEGKMCIEQQRDKKSIIEEQLSKYVKADYPAQHGLIESNVIIRDHNDAQVIDVMEDWWQEVKKFSRRDQLSFNYVVWKNKSSYAVMTGSARNTNDFFLLKEHAKKSFVDKVVDKIIRIFTY